MRKAADWRLLSVTAAATFAAALGVSGGTHAVMHVMGHELVRKHRATLTFRSAIFGDGVILPLVNVLMVRYLVRWKPRLGSPSSISAILGGTAITLLFHIAQGRGGMVNWTMTRPWRWNLLGYYHFIYMATQFAYMTLFWTELRLHWQEEDVRSKIRDTILISACLAAFGLLLATDYSD